MGCNSGSQRSCIPQGGAEKALEERAGSEDGDEPVQMASHEVGDLADKMGASEEPVLMTRAKSQSRKDSFGRQRRLSEEMLPSEGGLMTGSSSSRMSRAGSEFRKGMISKIEKAAADSGDNVPSGLEVRLESFNSRTMVMEGDGNCQFRSFAFNLFRDQAHHAAVRKSAVAHMRKHKDFFKVFFEDDKEFNKYMRSMAKDRTWGDELSLRAVVEAYGCIAHVITSELLNWYLVYRPEEPTVDPKIATCPKGHLMPPAGKQVFLSYVSPIHYNAIVARGRNTSILSSSASG